MWWERMNDGLDHYEGDGDLQEDGEEDPWGEVCSFCDWAFFRCGSSALRYSWAQLLCPSWYVEWGWRWWCRWWEEICHVLQACCMLMEEGVSCRWLPSSVQSSLFPPLKRWWLRRSRSPSLWRSLASLPRLIPLLWLLVEGMMSGWIENE